MQFKGVKTKSIVAAFFSDCFVGASTVIYDIVHVTYKCFGNMRYFFKEDSLVGAQHGSSLTVIYLECNTNCITFLKSS